MQAYLIFLQTAIPELWAGTLITLQITLVALIAGFFIGFPAALARIYGGKTLSAISTTYTEIFRGTPVLVQLFIIYYGLPQFGITLSAFMAAYVAMGLNSGAYQAEYFRGAIQAISSGQMMAAQSLGMNKLKAITYIIVPQAFRLALPAWANEVVSMVKVTSIVYLTAVPDLMTKAKILSSKYFNPIETYLTAAVFYLIIIGILSIVLNYIEKVSRIPGLEMEGEAR
ncbi:MAG: amino acid ABC transporter permease [Anaerolineales bacterium]|nr:amino acid ABC transporter permease [Anaerolineales bacterium]